MAIAKAQGLDLDLVQVDHIGESRKKLLDINPLGQIPVFVGPDGFVLTECIPITLYRTSSRGYALPSDWLGMLLPLAQAG